MTNRVKPGFDIEPMSAEEEAAEAKRMRFSEVRDQPVFNADLTYAPTSRAAIDKERIEELEAKVARDDEHIAWMAARVAQLEAEVERQGCTIKIQAENIAGYRAEVERLTQNEKDSSDSANHFHIAYDNARARIAKLEGALTKIAEHTQSRNNCVEIARKALEGK